MYYDLDWLAYTSTRLRYRQLLTSPTNCARVNISQHANKTTHDMNFIYLLQTKLLELVATYFINAAGFKQIVLL